MPCTSGSFSLLRVCWWTEDASLATPLSRLCTSTSTSSCKFWKNEREKRRQPEVSRRACILFFSHHVEPLVDNYLPCIVCFLLRRCQSIIRTGVNRTKKKNLRVLNSKISIFNLTGALPLELALVPCSCAASSERLTIVIVPLFNAMPHSSLCGH